MVSVEVGSSVSACLKSDVLCEFNELVGFSNSSINVELNDYTDGAVTVDVGACDTFNNSEAAESDVFTDGVDLVLDGFFNGVVGAVEFASLEFFDGCGLERDNGSEDALNEFYESSVLCNEVGFRDPQSSS